MEKTVYNRFGDEIVLKQGGTLRVAMKKGARKKDVAAALGISPAMVAHCENRDDREYTFQVDPKDGRLTLACKEWHYVRPRSTKSDHKRTRHY